MVGVTGGDEAGIGHEEDPACVQFAGEVADALDGVLAIDQAGARLIIETGHDLPCTIVGSGRDANRRCDSCENVIARGRGIRYSGCRMVHRMSDAARWLLLVALVYAPWAYGSISAGAVAGLNGILGLTLALWLVDCGVRRRMPRLPFWLVLAGGWLVVQAWWMALNGDEATGLTRSFRWAPGSVDQDLSVGMALRVTTLMGVVGMVMDLARHRKWRQRLWWTLGLTGASIVALGLVQVVSGAPGTFWRLDLDAPTFFATFPYHANAGAFLNVVWPVMAGLLMVAIREQAPPWERALWTLSLVGCLCGLFVNTSRGSGFVAVLLVVLWLAWLLLSPTRWRWTAWNRPALLGRALAVVGLATLIAMGIGVDRTLERWRGLEDELHEGNARWQASVTSLRIVGDAGVIGFGPGTFVRVYPLYLSDPRRHLEHAHNDYLQTLIEWGFLGAAAWALVFFGGPIRAGWCWARERGPKRTRDRILAFAGFSALLGLALHALVDYPLQIASIQLYAVVIVGLFWGLPHWNEKAALVPVATPLGTLGDWLGPEPEGSGVSTDAPKGSGNGSRHRAGAIPLPAPVPASSEASGIGGVGKEPLEVLRAWASSRPICVVFNPAARGDKARHFREHLNQLGPDCVLKPTTAAGTGRSLAAAAVRDGFSWIVAAGGDGTLNEVLNGIADEPGGLERVTLGLLPLGTSNVFARELGIPLRWDRAWAVIRRGDQRVMDLVQAVFETNDGRCERWFAQLAGAGLDARAVELVDWEWKKRVGFFAYVTAALRAMREPQPRISVHTDSGTVTGELVLIGNGQRYGGPFRLFPQADPADGRLDVHVYARANLWLAMACLGGLLTGRVGRVGRPERIRAGTLRLTASVRTPLQIDGEHVGWLPAELWVRHAGLRVIVPGPASEGNSG
jgi:diacylglycerol kinase (ATP)